MVKIPRSPRAGGVDAVWRVISLTAEKVRVVDLQSLLVNPLLLAASVWLLLDPGGLAVPVVLESHLKDTTAVHLIKGMGAFDAMGKTRGVDGQSLIVAGVVKI